MTPEHERRLRVAGVAASALIAAAVASAFTAWFIDGACNELDCGLGVLAYLGLFFVWPPLAGLVAGRLAWRRGFGDQVMLGVLLVWLVAHLAWPLPFFFAYRSIVGRLDSAAQTLAAWLVLGVVMIAVSWLAADLLERAHGKQRSS